MSKKLAWSFTDPSSFNGTKEEILEGTRIVRDEIKAKILEFIEEAKELPYWVS